MPACARSLLVMLLVGLEVASVGAGLRARCRQECRPAIADCVATTGKRIARCRSRTIHRCRRLGLAACEVTTTTLPPTCDVDCGSYCCESGYPVCSETGYGCCRHGFSVYCGNGMCCPGNYPVCGDDGQCHKPGGYVFIFNDGGTKETDDGAVATVTFNVVLSASAQNPQSIALSEAYFYAADELNDRFPADPARSSADCSGQLYLPPGGMQGCIVRFRIPDSVFAGVIHFDDGQYMDTASFNFPRP